MQIRTNHQPISTTIENQSNTHQNYSTISFSPSCYKICVLEAIFMRPDAQSHVMKISPISIGIGVAIGIAVTAVFLVPLLQPRPDKRGDTFVISGYINDVSESSIIITQNLAGKIETPPFEQCIDYCQQSDIHSKVSYDTVLHGCAGVQEGLDAKSCIES